MKKIILIFWLFSATIFAQEAKMIDDFGRIPCGEFMARMDLIFQVTQNSPDSNIYVIHYGGRYRREDVWNKKIKDYDKTKLEYPHREDELNWAKAIPLYLTTARETVPNLLKDRIILINGGLSGKHGSGNLARSEGCRNA